MLQDIQCERLVISGLLCSRQAVEYARETLFLDCFTDGLCRRVYEAITILDKDGVAIDIMSVFDSLQRRQRKDEATITAYEVAEFGQRYVADITEHIARLVDFANRRKIGQVAARLMQLSNDLTENAEEVLTHSRDIIDSEITHQQRRTLTIRESVKEVERRISDNASGARRTGTMTGFSWIDRRGGFQDGDLVIVAGASSMGKTSFALSAALNMTLRGEPTAYYSMEMQHYQLTARMLSMRTGVISSNILYKPLSAQERVRIDAAAPELAGKGCLYYDDESTTSIDGIIASIRSMHVKHKIKGAFIDYLQIVRLAQGGGRDEQNLADAARRLKNTAKSLGIWIVALSQLNRKTDAANDNPMPTMDRLRGSGQIAEAADTVILLYRPEYYDKKRFPPPFEGEDVHNRAMVIIGKGRNIGTGKFTCTFIPELTYYTELPPDRQPSVIHHDNDNNQLPFTDESNENDTNEYGDALPF